MTPRKLHFMRWSLLVVILCLGVTGCVQRVKISPYVRLSDEYLNARAAADRSERIKRLDELVKKLDDEVRKEVNKGAVLDLDLRFLLASTRYALYLENQDRTILPLFLNDLRHIRQHLNNSAALASDRLDAAVYNLSGDFLFRVAQDSWPGDSMPSCSPAEKPERNCPMTKALLSLALYEVAAAHYAQAWLMANETLKLNGQTTARPALRSQIEQAQDRLRSALNAQSNIWAETRVTSEENSILKDREDLEQNKPELFTKVAGVSNKYFLMEGDRFGLGDSHSLNNILATKQQKPADELTYRRRALRLAILMALNDHPEQIPNVSSSEHASDADLIARLLAFREAQITIESVQIGTNDQPEKIVLNFKHAPSFNLASLKTITLKIGERLLKIPHPTRSTVSLDFAQPLQWIIYPSQEANHEDCRPPTGQSSCFTSTPVGAVTQVVQFLHLPARFLKAEDRGKPIALIDAFEQVKPSSTTPQ